MNALPFDSIALMHFLINVNPKSSSKPITNEKLRPNFSLEV